MAFPIRQQLTRFAAIGGLATVLQYVLLAAMVELAGMHPVLASALSFAISALVNYKLNHGFTFGGTARHEVALPRFLLVAGVGLALNSAIMALAYTGFGVHYLLAQVIATGVVFAWTFTGNRLWSFQ